MLKIIMCGHGELAVAMKDSIEMVFGQIDNIQALTFSKTENREDLIEKFKQHLNKDDAHTLIVVDLYGGSPFNAAAMLAMQNSNIKVITGMSLPMCLEIASNACDMPVDALIPHLVESGQQSIKVFDQSVVQTNNNDDEDLL